MIPYTTAVATPRCAPSPAAPNAHAVTPSSGPQPAMLGATIAISTSNASGKSCETGATDRRSGTPFPGCGAVSHAIARLNASAAQ